MSADSLRTVGENESTRSGCFEAQAKDPSRGTPHWGDHLAELVALAHWSGARAREPWSAPASGQRRTGSAAPATLGPVGEWGVPELEKLRRHRLVSHVIHAERAAGCAARDAFPRARRRSRHHLGERQDRGLHVGRRHQRALRIGHARAARRREHHRRRRARHCTRPAECSAPRASARSLSADGTGIPLNGEWKYTIAPSGHGPAAARAVGVHGRA